MARRQVIEVPGLALHGEQPIPAAVKIGNQVFSGGISGQDPATGSIPDDPARQIALAFENAQRIVEAAGGTTGDIAKVSVSLKDMAQRGLVNEVWLRLFPDPADRPVRHTTRGELQGNRVIQLEIVAVL